MAKKLTKKSTKEGTSKQKKDAGTSKRRRKEATPSSSEEPDNLNDSDYEGETENASNVAQSDYMVDEDEALRQGGYDDIIDVLAYTAPKKHWSQKEYYEVRNINAYSVHRDTYNLYFRTQIQEQAFFGHLVDCTVFVHRRVDFAYLESKGVLAGVATKFENLGLRPFLEHRCDWNDTIIRQFYATYEIDFDNETLTWMTGKREFTATFAEFAAANQLNYEYFSDAEHSSDVYLEFLFEDSQNFYEPAHVGIPVSFGTPTGLRHHPAAINNILRHTFMPKSGNKDKIREYYWNVINHVMNGTRFNVVKMILEQMILKKKVLRDNIYFAPYIMSLIKVKAEFNGPCPVTHDLYRPFYNMKDFLSRPLTPIGEGDHVVDEGAPHVDIDDDAHAMPHTPPVPPMQPQGYWTPPEGYFTSYFEDMGQSLGAQMATGFQTMQQGFQEQLNTRFQDMSQHMNTQYYQPTMTQLQGMQRAFHDDMTSLSARFDGLSTSEQQQQLVDRQTQLETSFGTLNSAFSDFSGHFYSIFPAPVPPAEHYPYTPYYPPPPPPQDD